MGGFRPKHLRISLISFDSIGAYLYHMESETLFKPNDFVRWSYAPGIVMEVRGFTQSSIDGALSYYCSFIDDDGNLCNTLLPQNELTIIKESTNKLI
tara:strand:- start:263 stop:553 length:291 start_codon:yes stop_codon:yes gene_type:complete